MRKSSSGMLINLRVVFTFTRQRWSSMKIEFFHTSAYCLSLTTGTMKIEAENPAQKWMGKELYSWIPSNCSNVPLPTFIMPTCEQPRAPPPPRTRPTEVPVIRRPSRDRSEWMSGLAPSALICLYSSSITGVSLFNGPKNFSTLHQRRLPRSFSTL